MVSTASATRLVPFICLFDVLIVFPPKLFTKSLNNKIPRLSICLDMVADIDAEFKIEYFSFVQARDDVLEIWDLANSLGYKEFTYDITQPIYDDHRAFYVETGIPSLDIIDFDYPFWHTIEDVPSKCSPTAVLQTAGEPRRSETTPSESPERQSRCLSQ